MDKVAVVILNWNGSALLRQFLPSVVKHSEADGAVVYVADNGSTDDSLTVLREGFPTVKVITLEQNYGFAEGYNRALRQVEADCFVLLNSDVETTEGWLRPLVSFLDEHPDYAVCQPKLLSFHQRERFEYAGACGGFVDYLGYPFCRGRMFDTIEVDEGQYDHEEPRVMWASGAAFCVRAEAFRRAGGFDGRFFAHMEEIDLCWRLQWQGWEIACVPESKVYHVGGGTLRKENPRKTFLNFRNSLLMLYKNTPSYSLWIVMLMRWVLDYVAAFSFLLKGERQSFVAVFKARLAYRRMRPDFRKDREAILKGARVVSVLEVCPYSLLAQYYLRGRKSFKKIPCWNVPLIQQRM